MRISDWSSDVCSSDLSSFARRVLTLPRRSASRRSGRRARSCAWRRSDEVPTRANCGSASRRSEEHTSELQSLMRISYAVFCLKKKIIIKTSNLQHTEQHVQHKNVVERTEKSTTQK